MRNYSNIESRKFVGHDYYVGYGVDGAIYHIRKLADRSWYARSTAINGNSYGGKTLDEINRKLQGGTI